MDTIEDYYKDLNLRVFAEANVEDQELFLEQVFLDLAIDILHEAGELDNGTRCQYKGIGVKVDGFDLNLDLGTLDLLVSEYRSGSNTIPVLTKTELNNIYRRASKFLTRAQQSNFSESLEESAEIHDLIESIQEHWKSLRKIRIIVLTNALVKKFDGHTEILDDQLKISYQLWDIQRFYRFMTSGNKKEPISVNFLQDLGAPIGFVSSNGKSIKYKTYLCILPGELLFKLYDKWGTRLLERNVRAYLQARGRSVNAGIRKTLLNEGEMFLAYNNGITVTGKNVEFSKDDGVEKIHTIEDFQIVNGGQTTASIWHSKIKDGASLENVFVQMKLSVVSDNESLDEIVPLISKYSNSQNKVNTADFAANDPFHINIEKLSRSVWAPDISGGNNQTLWFYERSRGSFDEIRNRERTPAKKKAWDKLHPRSQKFDKVLLAKLEKTWMLQPYIVSLGAQKNFADFQVDIKEQNFESADSEYFKRLIGKLIIWKQAEKIVSRQKIPGYRANIVAYSLSAIIKHCNNRIDLIKIWEDQDISRALYDVIDQVAYVVREIITATNYNVTEYCKKESCWKKISTSELIENCISDTFRSELIDLSLNHDSTFKITPKETDSELQKLVVSIGADNWKKMSRWGAKTKLLKSWENGISYSIGRALAADKNPSHKQMVQGKRILEKAESLGFEKEIE